MSKNLKIYACSGIGATNLNGFSYWLDNTKSVSNTQAVNGLIARINLLYTEAVYLDLSKEETLNKLDAIDLYTVCVEAARKFQNNVEELIHAGQVIGSMQSAGDFEFDSLNEEERGNNLNELIAKMYSLMERDVTPDPEFMSWWMDEVVNRNEVGLSEAQQRIAIDSLSQKTVSGSNQQADLVSYLNGASESVLYRYFTQDQLAKLPYVFTRKRKAQDNLYQYWLPIYKELYGDNKMDDVIRGGIIKQFGAQPEKVCEDIVRRFEAEEAVGTGGGAVMIGVFTVAEFLTLLGTLATLVVGIVSAICTTVANIRVAEVQQVDLNAIHKDIPNQDDYPEDWNRKNDLGNNIYWIGAAALAAILLLK